MATAIRATGADRATQTVTLTVRVKRTQPDQGISNKWQEFTVEASPLDRFLDVLNRIKCEQAQHVIGDIKHYAVNDQESGRNEVDSIISKRAMRESDLLAFQIGVGIADPGAVMCSYNSVNGDFACENKYLLTDVLKKEWGFKGFVVSDWGGTHSTVKASAAGLDNEEPLDEFFGAKLKAAVEAGKVSTAELDDHVRRVLRSEFACGIVDHPTQKAVADVEGDLETARKIEEQSAVLLKNNGLLPLTGAVVKSIAETVRT